MIKRGWEFELRSLRHYVERHFGSLRQVAWLRRRATQPEVVVWYDIMRIFAVADRGACVNPDEGKLLASPTSLGRILRGWIEICDPPHQFVAVVSNCRDALFRVKLEGRPNEWVDIDVWMAVWGLQPMALQRFAQTWTGRLTGLLAPWAAIPIEPGGGHC